MRTVGAQLVKQVATKPMIEICHYRYAVGAGSGTRGNEERYCWCKPDGPAARAFRRQRKLPWTPLLSIPQDGTKDIARVAAVSSGSDEIGI